MVFTSWKSFQLVRASCQLVTSELDELTRACLLARKYKLRALANRKLRPGFFAKTPRVRAGFFVYFELKVRKV